MNVQEELIDPEEFITREHVRMRVDNWRRRIEELYARVTAWLPPGWSADDGGQVHFEEELMHRFQVKAERLPALELRSSGEQARLEPRGLWIIGTNGRVDLIRADRHFLIVDRADVFDEPDWQVSAIENRRNQRPLDAAVLRDMLQ